MLKKLERLAADATDQDRAAALVATVQKRTMADVGKGLRDVGSAFNLIQSHIDKAKQAMDQVVEPEQAPGVAAAAEKEDLANKPVIPDPTLAPAAHAPAPAPAPKKGGRKKKEPAGGVGDQVAKLAKGASSEDAAILAAALKDLEDDQEEGKGKKKKKKKKKGNKDQENWGGVDELERQGWGTDDDVAEESVGLSHAAKARVASVLEGIMKEMLQPNQPSSNLSASNRLLFS